ncbi:MAG: 16S rRNA (uracil(1498)-N(3))-methyltransferase, partial [Gemmatimonadales bacterium]
MNLILLFPDDFVSGAPDRVLLRGRRLLHVTQVQRASIGDKLRVGILGGQIGKGRISALGTDSLEMEIRLEREPPAPLPATLVLA